MTNRLAAAAAKFFLAAALALALVAPLAASGCGGASTPQRAVEDFYRAIQEGDWNAYLNTILPDNVRRMTQSDLQETKEQFNSSDYQYKGLKLKTIADEKDADRAKVELVSGTIVGTNPGTGERESTTIAEIKKAYGITPTIDVRRFRGRWYVDIPMASADKQTQQNQ